MIWQALQPIARKESSMGVGAKRKKNTPIFMCCVDYASRGYRQLELVARSDRFDAHASYAPTSGFVKHSCKIHLEFWMHRYQGSPCDCETKEGRQETDKQDC
jgi:hypothetical protein